jgi:tetratricopeptide (TPR) repeat protein
MAAVEALFAEGPPPAASESREAHTRLVDFERAMRRIVDAYPDDTEALAIWAGSRVVMFPRTERAMQDRMRTAAAAKEVLGRNPRHPGGARYLLQSTDDPIHASVGWEGARVFMEAPAEAGDATAQHMPSHTFAQLGMWSEMAEANMQAFDTSMEWTRRNGFRLQDLNNHNYGHLLNYGQYGYLQSGQYARAREIIAQAETDYGASEKAAEIANTLRSTLTLYVAETKDPEWLARLEEVAAAEGWADDREVQFTLGLVGAQTGDMELTRAALSHLQGSTDVMGRIMRNQLAALVAFADGDTGEGLELMEEASRLEADRLYSHFGPPSPLEPAHELYGDLLLQANRPEEALEAFESSLWIFSRRPDSVLGAARAAEAAAQAELARTYYDELTDLLASADPEVRERYQRSGT